MKDVFATKKVLRSVGVSVERGLNGQVALVTTPLVHNEDDYHQFWFSPDEAIELGKELVELGYVSKAERAEAKAEVEQAEANEADGDVLHFHFDGPVFGDKKKVAKELTDAIRQELDKRKAKS